MWLSVPGLNPNVFSTPANLWTSGWNRLFQAAHRHMYMGGPSETFTGLFCLYLYRFWVWKYAVSKKVSRVWRKIINGDNFQVLSVSPQLHSSSFTSAACVESSNCCLICCLCMCGYVWSLKIPLALSNDESVHSSSVQIVNVRLTEIIRMSNRHVMSPIFFKCTFSISYMSFIYVPYISCYLIFHDYELYVTVFK